VFARQHNKKFCRFPDLNKYFIGQLHLHSQVHLFTTSLSQLLALLILVKSSRYPCNLFVSHSCQGGWCSYITGSSSMHYFSFFLFISEGIDPSTWSSFSPSVIYWKSRWFSSRPLTWELVQGPHVTSSWFQELVPWSLGSLFLCRLPDAPDAVSGALVFSGILVENCPCHDPDNCVSYAMPLLRSKSSSFYQWPVPSMVDTFPG
jgi:hypothetical protein